jgi:transposase
LPLKKGCAGTMTHDYKRNGTTTLFAALNVATGEVIGECMPRHRSEEFLKFLKKIDRETLPNLDLHLIADNYSTHKTPAVQRWLKRHPRFKLHFIPTSSWLNLVERLFAEITPPENTPRGLPHRYRTGGGYRKMDQSSKRQPDSLRLDRDAEVHHSQAQPGQKGPGQPRWGMQMNVHPPLKTDSRRSKSNSMSSSRSKLQPMVAFSVLPQVARMASTTRLGMES